MTLQQLRYVLEVAEAGTLRKAAERLFITQPSLTAAIRELESEFGIEVEDEVILTLKTVGDVVDYIEKHQ